MRALRFNRKRGDVLNLVLSVGRLKFDVQSAAGAFRFQTRIFAPADAFQVRICVLRWRVRCAVLNAN